MTNSKTLFDGIIRDLTLNETLDEISALAFATLNYFGISRTDVISNKPVDLEYEKLAPIISRLNQHEPLQYILNEAWFYGHKFYVNPSVLIPRPETEVLVEAAAAKISSKNPIHILDIGTGSGCIAISLALKFPNAVVHAIDVSIGALEVAKKNALDLKATVQFNQLDILKEIPANQKFDLIVSNPPYIAATEKSTLPKNVADFEPHLALFASENDPLNFYRAIAIAAHQLLNPGGSVGVEINEQFGEDVYAILGELEFIKTTLINDLAGKPRVIIASKSL